MKIFEVLFQKKTGEMRHMRFVRLSDLPEDFLSRKIKKNTNENQKTLGYGRELVWDIDKRGFRCVDWNSMAAKSEKEGEVVLE